MNKLFSYLDIFYKQRKLCLYFYSLHSKLIFTQFHQTNLFNLSIFIESFIKIVMATANYQSNNSIISFQKVVSDKRPLWYIFSGMGTQWPCMAKQLMNLEVFANSIRSSAKVLKPYNLDLIDLVTNGVKDTSNARSIIPAFVSIAAVQVSRILLE